MSRRVETIPPVRSWMHGVGIMCDHLAVRWPGGITGGRWRAEGAVNGGRPAMRLGPRSTNRTWGGCGGRSRVPAILRGHREGGQLREWRQITLMGRFSRCVATCGCSAVCEELVHDGQDSAESTGARGSLRERRGARSGRLDEAIVAVRDSIGSTRRCQTTTAFGDANGLLGQCYLRQADWRGAEDTETARAIAIHGSKHRSRCRATLTEAYRRGRAE
jgi:hypothetical protein